MRLYLSSFRVGDHPDQLVRLVDDNVRTALILNADDHKDRAARTASLRREIDELRSIGLEPFEVDLRDHFDGDTDLERILGGGGLIYVRGGNVFLLRRALRHSGADAIIMRLLREDAVVYGGYSAGSCVLGPTLRAFGGHVDDAYATPSPYPTVEPIWEGLGVVDFSIVPHYRSDHPESDEVERSTEYLIDHHHPFIALRDGEVIVIEGGRRTVFGRPTRQREVSYDLTPVGWVHSTLTERDAAPRQGDEGAPRARIEFRPDMSGAISDLRAGDRVVVVTWLHQGRRDVVAVHPRGDRDRPRRGVFSTRSPDRPNPIGLHTVTVAHVDHNAIVVQGLEAIDGTPVVDVKPVLGAVRDR